MTASCDAHDVSLLAAYSRGLDAIAALQVELAAIGNGAPPSPRWSQAEFPGLDAAFAYALVRTRKPRRIVQCEAGAWTDFFARAIADGGLTTILEVSPSLPDAAGRAQAGDVLFIRREVVDREMRDLVPVLAAGALVHVRAPGPAGDARLAPVWDSGWILDRMADALLARDLDTIPMLPGARPSSLWFVKR